MRQRGTTHLSDPPYGGYPMPKSRRKRLSAVDRVKKYDTVVSSGQSALKALLTVTGGAILVIASLLGHLRDKGPIPPHSVHLFGMSLSWFMWAVVLALLAYGSIFITNCFSSINWDRWSNGAFAVTLLCSFGSLGCFVVAGLRAVEAFQSAMVLLSR